VRSKKKNLRPAGASRNESLKPRPPKDFWDALNKERRRTLQNQEAPPGSFSTVDYQRRFHVNGHRARYELTKLVVDGIIADLGRFGPTRLHYYEYCA
jgi:hypothetical protein